MAQLHVYNYKDVFFTPDTPKQAIVDIYNLGGKIDKSLEKYKDLIELGNVGDNVNDIVSDMMKEVPLLGKVLELAKLLKGKDLYQRQAKIGSGWVFLFHGARGANDLNQFRKHCQTAFGWTTANLHNLEIEQLYIAFRKGVVVPMSLWGGELGQPYPSSEVFEYVKKPLPNKMGGGITAPTHTPQTHTVPTAPQSVFGSYIDSKLVKYGVLILATLYIIKKVIK